jgi:hypothetical protein
MLCRLHKMNPTSKTYMTKVSNGIDGRHTSWSDSGSIAAQSGTHTGHPFQQLPMAHDQCCNEHKRTPSDKEKPRMSPVVEIFEAPADEHSNRAKPREQAQRLANDREHGDQHGTAR